MQKKTQKTYNKKYTGFDQVSSFLFTNYTQIIFFAFLIFFLDFKKNYKK